MIFDKLLGKLQDWWYPKKFKVGDNVRCDTRTYWQDLTITKYDFYYKGWYLYATDNSSGYIFSEGVYFKEDELELLPPEFLPYDPKQQGDTDEDI